MLYFAQAKLVLLPNKLRDVSSDALETGIFVPVVLTLEVIASVTTVFLLEIGMIAHDDPFKTEHIGRLARMSVLDTEVDGSNPGSSMLFP